MTIANTADFIMPNSTRHSADGNFMFKGYNGMPFRLNGRLVCEISVYRYDDDAGAYIYRGRLFPRYFNSKTSISVAALMEMWDVSCSEAEEAEEVSEY